MKHTKIIAYALMTILLLASAFALAVYEPGKKRFVATPFKAYPINQLILGNYTNQTGLNEGYGSSMQIVTLLKRPANYTHSVYLAYVTVTGGFVPGGGNASPSFSQAEINTGSNELYTQFYFHGSGNFNFTATTTTVFKVETSPSVSTINNAVLPGELYYVTKVSQPFRLAGYWGPNE